MGEVHRRHDRPATCREAARIVGINLKTAFYWRHKVLAGLNHQQAPKLGGIVEADEKVFRRSYKGSRAFKKGLIPRKPRQRGGRTHPDGSIRGFGKDKVAVLVARSRDGMTVPIVLRHYTGKSVKDGFGLGRCEQKGCWV